jgi:hypothetical protein
MAVLPPLAVLLQGGVVVGGQLEGQLGIQSGPLLGWAAWNWFGAQGAGLAALPEIPLDRREGDLEHLHNLLAWGAVIDSVEDPLAKIG